VEAYCRVLNVDMGNYEFFVLADIIQMQSVGQITRDGFIKGWKQVWEETKGKVSPDMMSHQRYVRSQIGLVQTDTAVFRKVYRNAFTAGKEPGKRELGMGEALAYWAELLAPTLQRWKTSNVDWFQAWTDYLTERFGTTKLDDDGEEVIEYKRTVSRDLWNQTLLFAEKTMQDETLGFWSEEQAWPGLIDEFVVWCQEKGIAAAKNGETMEVGA
jgi:DCN1-like protein 1/2